MDKQTQDVDSYLANQIGWQAYNLVTFRKLVHDIEPTIKEEWKWSVPCFTMGGKVVMAMATFKDFTKFNFFEGALLSDTHHLFNSGLDSKKQHSINLYEGEHIPADHLRNLIEEAITLAKRSL